MVSFIALLFLKAVFFFVRTFLNLLHYFPQKKCNTPDIEIYEI